MAVLRPLIAWLESQSVPYVAIGGISVSLLSRPRATQDVDAVIWLDAERWADFVRSGESYGFAPRIGDVVEFAVRTRILLLQHHSDIGVDLSCGVLPFEREMIDRAMTFDIGKSKLKVPTPEDLIITKAVAQRPKDIADIEALLSVHRNLDLARIRHWTREFAAVLEMPEMLENLDRIVRRYEAQQGSES